MFDGVLNTPLRAILLCKFWRKRLITTGAFLKIMQNVAIKQITNFSASDFSIVFLWILQHFSEVSWTPYDDCFYLKSFTWIDLNFRQLHHSLLQEHNNSKRIFHRVQKQNIQIYSPRKWKSWPFMPWKTYLVFTK